MWFDGSKALTYNCLFNFIVGQRGLGKTYWAKKWCVKDFINNGNQFVYIRRYKSEISVNNFFDQIRNEFPDADFQVKGKAFFINGSYAGQAIALSTGITKKSMSFERTYNVIYDEFIIEEGNYRYLKNEVKCFLDLYETINRLRIDDKEARVFFLANAISLYNPYFVHFGIKFDRSNVYRGNEIYAEIGYDDEFTEAKRKTRFGKLIQGTEYEQYILFNNFYLDNKDFIGKKVNACSYAFTLTFENKTFGVWIDYKGGKYYVSHDVDPYCKKSYAFTTADHKPNTLMIKAARRSLGIKQFVENYKLGNVWFESVGIKNAMTDLLKMILF